MKYLFTILVLCVYISTIRPIFLEGSWRRLFGGDQINTNSRKYKNARVANKPYARNLKSVNDDDLKLDLENVVAAARSKLNIISNPRQSYLRRIQHTPDNADVGSQVLDSIKEYRKQFTRRNANKRVDTEKSNFKKKKGFRRNKEDTSSESSDLELGDLNNWKVQWKHEWLGKKVQALSPDMTTPKGDFVNMAAARPWGVPCGDPMQHDMPWGTCLLPMECEPEYRIYRGDKACGKTQFVCCALQLNVYDNYQGFDVSFADTSMATDPDDMEKEDSKDTAERKRRKEKKERRRREKERKKRKKRMRKNIQRIVKKIKMILNRMYQNTTKQRKIKTKGLKSYIKMLKRKYKEDRKNVKKLHVDQLQNVDNQLFERLNQILAMNKEFANNDTFREIITNGTLSKKAARMLSVMYPDLAPDLTIYTRRTGDADIKDKENSYDVEYGFLYY